MNADATLLPPGIWEKLWASSPYWFCGAVLLPWTMLRDQLGPWTAATVAVVPAMAAALLVRRAGRKRRLRRIEANIARGVIEAVVRYPDEAGIAPNSGWRAGYLALQDSGFRFQQLRGRTSGPVGAPLQILSPRPLGARPLRPREAPERGQGFQALGFAVGQCPFEVAGDPLYLRGLALRGDVDADDAPP
ncbi:hypothetical protein E2F48_02325 [Arthrobacter crusticola]|uniref:Uncharacterized protein n=1 Tax=Arthrobacter crusticola TaxID=2547960 RepID=A0A4R5U2T5_9MICC|nr:hypothetical protein [Arthrobacter crusticola]TDK27966.1 hypothetical protein E2F48_02325 [Arthrobacter crusticola]